MGDINLTLWIVLVSFLVFVQLMKHLFFKPVAAILARREADLAALRRENDGFVAEYMDLKSELEMREEAQKKRLRQTWAKAQQEQLQQFNKELAKNQLALNERLNEHKAANQGLYQAAQHTLTTEVDQLSQAALQKLLHPST